MSTRLKKPQRGRPAGSRSFDAETAQAFGAVLRAARLSGGISQEGLAFAADVERSYLGRIERGHSQPTLFVILKLAAALHMDAGALLTLAEREIKRARRAASRANASS